MTIRLISLVAILAWTVTAPSAYAVQPYKGEVVKVDAAKGKITLKRGPIARFEMGPMTMGYRVADPTMLRDVEAGDRVTFDVDGADGSYTVTKIEKAK